MALNLLDKVFLLHLALKTTQRVFEGLGLLKPHFHQLTTPKLVPLDPIVIARFRKQVKGELAKNTRKHRLFSIADATALFFTQLENQLHGELDLARSICAGRPGQVRRPLIVSREVTDSNRLIQLHEIRGGIREAVIGNRDAPVIAIQGIECFRD